MKMPNIDDLKEKIQNLIEEKKRILLLVALPFLAALLFLTAALIFFDKNEKKSANPADNLVLLEPLSLPEAAEENVHYAAERLSKTKWDKDEAALYFHAPEEGAKEKLRMQNERAINEILEAVP